MKSRVAARREGTCVKGILQYEEAIFAYTFEAQSHA